MKRHRFGLIILTPSACLAGALHFFTLTPDWANPLLAPPPTPEAKQAQALLHNAFHPEEEAVEFVVQRFELPSAAANPGLTHSLEHFNSLNDLLTKDIGSVFGLGIKLHF